jgi:hypothetical protein
MDALKEKKIQKKMQLKCDKIETKKNRQKTTNTREENKNKTKNECP